jgi:hypothetical protein
VSVEQIIPLHNKRPGNLFSRLRFESFFVCQPHSEFIRTQQRTTKEQQKNNKRTTKEQQKNNKRTTKNNKKKRRKRKKKKEKGGE